MGVVSRVPRAHDGIVSARVDPKNRSTRKEVMMQKRNIK